MTYRLRLFALLGAGMALRVAYVLAQPHGDPSYAHPILDGEYYLAMARSLLGAGPSPETGAYYLAPLYPRLLAAWLWLAGERYGVLYLTQHAFLVATAGLLAGVARRAAGDGAGIAAAALVLLYHPFLYFASRPLGEALALLLLAGSLALAYGGGRAAPLGAGLMGGLGALARPNLLLVPVALISQALWTRRWVRAVLFALGLALAIAPVALRNATASGHFVAISSNAGLTLYHGNGPGARGGFTFPSGFTGRVVTQREEATQIARAQSGQDLDDVEADRYWGREAWRVRLDDPSGTLALFARRALLLVDDAEHGLDYAPFLDPDPWRWAAPLPFAALLFLAVAGLALRGVSGTGGGRLWLGTAACAVAPVLFFTASRYRLPLAALLCVPAGVGFSSLLALPRRPTRREGWAILLAAAAAGLALFEPSAALVHQERATAFSNLAALRRRQGDLAEALSLARQALEENPDSAVARYNLGVFLRAAGRGPEAEEAFAQALRTDPGFAEAAVNLSSLLLEEGRAREAVPVLRTALAAHPSHPKCWKNLVAALALSGETEAARAAAAEAERRGVKIDNVPSILGAPPRNR